MLYEESLWIKENLKTLNLPKDSTVLNLGSSNLKYMTKKQPYIEENVLGPLKKKRLKIINADKNKGKGVDIVVDAEDICLDDQFNLILCNSLLEHVKNIKLVVKNMLNTVKKGGFILVSVPKKYPCHTNFDNGFRPSAKKLEKLFLKQNILKSETINGGGPNQHEVSLVLLQKIK